MKITIAAIVAAFIKGLTATSVGEAITAVGLAGLTVGIFVAFFVQRPSAALERNAIFMPWVSIVLTTFWTRLLYLDDPATLDQRHLNADKLAHMYRDAIKSSEEIAAAEKIEVAWKKIWSIQPFPFHPELIDLGDQAIHWPG